MSTIEIESYDAQTKSLRSDETHFHGDHGVVLGALENAPVVDEVPLGKLPVSVVELLSGESTLGVDLLPLGLFCLVDQSQSLPSVAALLPSDVAPVVLASPLRQVLGQPLSSHFNLPLYEALRAPFSLTRQTLPLEKHSGSNAIHNSNSSHFIDLIIRFMLTDFTVIIYADISCYFVINQT